MCSWSETPRNRAWPQRVAVEDNAQNADVIVKAITELGDGTGPRAPRCPSGHWTGTWVPAAKLPSSDTLACVTQAGDRPAPAP